MNMRNIQGFSLVEVLVALLVLSVGLLGMAGLQGYSLSSSYDAHLRTQATALTQDIIGRMRANRDMATSNNYQTSLAEIPELSHNCNESTCTPAQLANFDLIEWKCALGAYIENEVCMDFALDATLPQGDGEIVQLADGQIQISVNWAATDSENTQRQVRIITRI
jgi:type IV pilus assembly protein PilV